MNKALMKQSIGRFLKNSRGNWAIIQLPNILLSTWIILIVVNYLFDSQPTRLLQSTVLFAWAYIELKDGDSLFRRTLGAII